MNMAIKVRNPNAFQILGQAKEGMRPLDLQVERVRLMNQQRVNIDVFDQPMSGRYWQGIRWEQVVLPCYHLVTR